MQKDNHTIIQNPFFMVGAVRSGTTLLRLMLDYHPKIAFAPEFEYAVSEVSDDGKFPEITDYHRYLDNNAVFKRCHFKVDPFLGYKDLVDDFLHQKIKDGIDIVGATVHEHFDRCLHIWPNAKFIHIIRDPRDVARSAIAMGWCGNVWVGSQIWVETEKLWSEFSKTLQPEQFIEIKYEDLIADHTAVLSRICEFMGTQYDEKMMDYVRDTTYDVPDPSRVYPWRKKLDELGVQQVESQCGELIEQRGYELSGLPIKEFSSNETESFLKDSDRKKRQFRINRYGFWLLSFAKLTKILKLGWVNSYFQTKIDRVSSQYIK